MARRVVATALDHWGRVEQRQQAAHLRRGARLCLGHALARAEMTEALQIFASRFPDMELAGEAEFTPSPTLLGPERLPLRLRR